MDDDPAERDSAARAFDEAPEDAELTPLEGLDDPTGEVTVADELAGHPKFSSAAS